ncbi:metallophosphoesterase family protein [Candidatus Woesearchaeota archaeon]|nr:metallophosphoesterase family protein [Candidatus Woesearchaeota archaeon]
MKLLAFVDLHGSKKAMEKLLSKVRKEKPDIIICAGDFTVFEQDMEHILFTLNHLNIPILLVHGNHETALATRKGCSLFENLHFIHGKAHRMQNVLFLGCGGGGFSQRDPDIHLFESAWRKSIRKDDILILVTHAPPYKTRVDAILDEHCGNKSFAAFIKQTQPHYCFCGHFHENAGIKDQIGKTTIINPGPQGVIVQI